MSLGATLAGIDITLAVDRDVHSTNTYRRNHANCKVLVQDVRSVSEDTITSIPKGNNGTVVLGGPPCQGFSYSNTRTRNLDNEHNWLFLDFIRFIAIWEPDFFVFENVRGIVNIARGAFFKILIERFSDLPYCLSYGVLNARDFGVPQDRGRFFLIGSRTGSAVPLPNPTVTPSTPIYTVADAIRDLPCLTNGASISWREYGDIPPSTYARSIRNTSGMCPNNLVTRNQKHVVCRYKHIPQGGNWENIPKHLMRNYQDPTRCHTGIYHRLRSDLPSVVIGNYRKNMLIHPIQDRGLSVREAARIQSFPDNYEFMGSIGFQQQQVGNAVPPVLAREVFANVMRYAS